MKRLPALEAVTVIAMLVACANRAPAQRTALTTPPASASPRAHVALRMPEPRPRATVAAAKRAAAERAAATPTAVAYRPAMSAKARLAIATPAIATPAIATPAAAAPATATPAVTTSSPAPAVPQLPPDAAPQIVALYIDRTTVRGGDTVNGSIVTSSNVASVEARIGYFSIPVPKTGEGRFAVRYTVPHLPFFLHRTYSMAVIARNAAGVAAVRNVAIRLR